MNNLITALLIALCFVATNSDTAVAQNSSRFDITLDDNWETKLKSLGTLQSTVRSDSRGKIAAIQIEFTDTQSKPHVLSNVPFTIAGDACQLTLNDELLATARAQPVRIPIPANSEFAQVFLNYNSSETAPDSSSADATVGNNADSDDTSGTDEVAMQSSSEAFSEPPPMHYVKLADRKVVFGQMDLTEKLKFTTKFGEVDIALGQVAGIRFHIDGEDSALIVLKNGDSVTGIPVMDSLNLSTDWGRAEFDPVYVDEITTSQRASFTQSNDPQFGQRWKLSNR